MNLVVGVERPCRQAAASFGKLALTLAHSKALSKGPKGPWCTFLHTDLGPGERNFHQLQNPNTGYRIPSGLILNGALPISRVRRLTAAASSITPAPSTLPPTTTPYFFSPLNFLSPSIAQPYLSSHRRGQLSCCQVDHYCSNL